MQVSLERIEAFLALDEAPRRIEFAPTVDLASVPPVALSIDWETLWWGPDRAALSKVRASIAAGELIGVVGQVGSGKTAFLLGLLRELQHAGGGGGGGLDDCGDAAGPASAIGYFAQEPAILNGKISDNVLFGLPFKADRYDEAVSAACLEADLAIMPAGSDTEIGERGVNLSGGQKARVAFARTLYHRDRCGVFLFDDPFASVDVHVGKRMFEHGINGHLKGRTRIVVVSSQTELLRSADTILELKDGRLTVKGTGAEVFGPTGTAVTTDPPDEVAGAAGGGGGGPRLAAAAAAAPAGRRATEVEVDAGRQLSTVEARAKGAVEATVYTSYFGFAVSGRAYTTGGLVLLMYLVGQTVRVMADVWLMWWADAADRGAAAETPGSFFDGRDSAWWITSLGIWNGANIALAVARSVICVALAMRSSAGVHRDVLGNMLQTTLLWFQRNPPGKILNRLSTDLHRVDTLLPDTLYQFLDNVFVLITAVVLALVAVPWLLLLLLPYGALLYVMQKYHRAASRELLRLDGTSKTPLYGLYGETMHTRTTIRAFEAQGMLLQRERDLANKNLKMYFHVRMLERWISLYINLAVSVLGLALILVAVSTKDAIDPAIVGLALVYCLQLMGMSSWTIMLFVQLESHMTSLERLVELCEVPAQEPPAARDAAVQTAPDWPKDGAIELAGVRLRYRPNLPLALKNLTFSIRPREKIGVCGRTGAGACGPSPVSTGTIVIIAPPPPPLPLSVLCLPAPPPRASAAWAGGRYPLCRRAALMLPPPAPPPPSQNDGRRAAQASRPS